MTPVTPGAVTIHGSAEPTQRRLDATARQPELAEVLGPVRIRIVEAVLICDVSWRALAEQLQLVSSCTAKSEAIDAVRALHAFQSGQPVPLYRSRHRGRYQVRARA
jgi:hypothetical protein